MTSPRDDTLVDIAIELYILFEGKWVVYYVVPSNLIVDGGLELRILALPKRAGD